MPLPLDHVREAGRLLQYALRPRNSPAAQPEYAALFSRYQGEPDFRQTTRDLADGLGLQIYDASERYGLLLVCRVDSPFLPRLKDFKDRMSVNERVGYGLLFYLVAAHIYPSEDILNDDLEVAPRIQESECVRHVLATCEAIKQRNESMPALSEKLILGVDQLLSIREGGRHKDRHNLTYMVSYLFRYYVETGLFREENARKLPKIAADDADESGETEALIYRPQPAYRIQVRFMLREGFDELTELFHQARAGTESPHA